MVQFIDRRLNAKGKSTVNRQRFLRRYRNQIKKAVSEAVGKRSIENVDGGESVSIPTKDIGEPTFHQGKGGHNQRVLPGNDNFSQGDQIPRPPSDGQGGGNGEGDASNQGEGEDEFVFSISRDEYLDLLFEDLELPNLQKNQLEKMVNFEQRRAGFKSEGMPNQIDITRSLKSSIARRIALTAGKKSKLKQLKAELEELLKESGENTNKVLALKDQIKELEYLIKRVPFIDTFDLRYRNYEQHPVPTSKAVMFCLMDVSGSMDQATKDMAKRFYILLYTFLTRTYKNVDVVYIRHHTQAKEVDEEEFFYSQETGGTIVSSALDLMLEIVEERYPSSDWNIYAAQASDGDNWADDSPKCRYMLIEKLMPLLRYYAYIEITQRQHQSLWREYLTVQAHHPHFAMQHIRSVEDIYPIFRKLFSKRQDKESN